LPWTVLPEPSRSSGRSQVMRAVNGRPMWIFDAALASAGVSAPAVDAAPADHRAVRKHGDVRPARWVSPLTVVVGAPVIGRAAVDVESVGDRDLAVLPRRILQLDGAAGAVGSAPTIDPVPSSPGMAQAD
jgi:hypothetical protein